MDVKSHMRAHELSEKWDASYERLENTLFFPSESVIRFVNKHVRRRTGINSYTRFFAKPPEVLEIGSGAGRHIAFLTKAGFRLTGVELSAVACEQARNLLTHEGVTPQSYTLLNASATDLPIADCKFDYAISVATLDSMPTETARAVIGEVCRTLKPGGLFYVDLIADDALRQGNIDASGDQVVMDAHENGTIQSYFNVDKIKDLFADFKVCEIYKIQMVSVDNTLQNSRFYVTFEKPNDL